MKKKPPKKTKNLALPSSGSVIYPSFQRRNLYSLPLINQLVACFVLPCSRVSFRLSNVSSSANWTGRTWGMKEIVAEVCNFSGAA